MRDTINELMSVIKKNTRQNNKILKFMAPILQKKINKIMDKRFPHRNFVFKLFFLLTMN